MTWTAMLAIVRQRINETTASRWTDAELLSNANEWYYRVRNAVIEVNKNYYEVSANASTANGPLYAMPSDLVDPLNFKELEIDYDNDDKYVQAQRVPQEYLGGTGQTAGQFTTTNPAYYIKGRNVGVYPTPTTTVSDGLRFWYIKDITRLSSGSDSPDVPEELIYPIINGAAGMALKSKGETDGEYWLKEANNGINKYIERSGKSRPKRKRMLSTREQYTKNNNYGKW